MLAPLLAKHAISDPPFPSKSGEAPPSRVSKAAKRRKRAAAKAQSLSKAVEESLTKNASSTSALEYCQLERALFERGLTLHKVKHLSDGMRITLIAKRHP